MTEVALFINGIFARVLDEILETQSEFPGYTLFLQPYSADPIRLLRDNVPSPDAPVTLYASASNDLANVRYTADIVGWEDKTAMNPSRRREVTDIIQKRQQGERGNDMEEAGLYNMTGSDDKPSRNLIHIRRAVKLDVPFSVGELIKTSDDEPLSINRTMPGRWSPVYKPD